MSSTSGIAVKNVLVLGATGPTGRHVVAQGLETGYTITALVRDPRKLMIDDDRSKLVVGDATNDEALAEAVRGQDAVISTLGVGMSFNPRGLMATAVPKLVAAMERHGPRRLVFTSAFGVGETWRDTPPVARVFIGTLLASIYADKRAGDAAIKRSTLDWTLVCPTGLTDGPRTGRYRCGERLDLGGFPTISRADVAAFLLSQLQDTRFLHKEVLVSS